VCLWNSPSSCSRKHRILSLQTPNLWRPTCIAFSRIFANSYAVDYTEFGNWYKNVCIRHLSATPATWSSAVDTWASMSQNVIDEVVGQCRKRLRAWVKAKGHYFEHLLNTGYNSHIHNRMFSEPSDTLAVYRGKHVMFCVISACRSYLKAIKVKVNWKCANAVYPEISKLARACPLQTIYAACQSWRVFWNV